MKNKKVIGGTCRTNAVDVKFRSRKAQGRRKHERHCENNNNLNPTETACE
jgi:hypothetical protein